MCTWFYYLSKQTTFMVFFSLDDETLSHIEQYLYTGEHGINPTGTVKYGELHSRTGGTNFIYPLRRKCSLWIWHVHNVSSPWQQGVRTDKKRKELHSTHLNWTGHWHLATINFNDKKKKQKKRGDDILQRDEMTIVGLQYSNQTRHLPINTDVSRLHLPFWPVTFHPVQWEGAQTVEASRSLGLMRTTCSSWPESDTSKVVLYLARIFMRGRSFSHHCSLGILWLQRKGEATMRTV